MRDDSATHTRGASASPGFSCARHRARLLLVGVTLLAPATARPQEEPVATIVVTGEAPTAAEAKAPTGFVSVIDAEEGSTEGQTVGEALAETVGVQVRRFGGLGAFSTLSIRGSASNQVQVYLDGIPLSRANNETVNLADLPFDSLERIEVYRGITPVEFGLGSIGGVVNLVTRPPSAVPETTLGASYGSFDTRKMIASHSRRLGAFEILAFVTYLGSEGDFTFRDDNGTPENPSDDETVNRRNNDFDSVDGLVKVARSLDNGLRFELTSETFYKDEGVPGIGSFQARSARQRTFRSLNALRVVANDLLPEDLEASNTLFGVYEHDEFVDLGGSGSGGELGFLKQDRSDDTTLAGAATTLRWFPLPEHELSAFTELSHERFDGSNAARSEPADEPDQTRLIGAVALQDQADLLDGLLLLVPALRYEHLHDSASATFDAAGRPSGPRRNHDEDLWSASAGAVLRPCEWLSFKGNIGRYPRAPSFSELYGQRGNVRGNPDLRPETALNRDVGFLLSRDIARVGPGYLEYAYFNNDVDDLIALVQTSPNFFTARNVGKARLRGHELNLGATIRDRVGVNANYTHQDADNRSDSPILRGKRLPGRPAEEVYLRASLFAGLATPYYEFNFLSGNFTDQANLREIPSRDTHTLGVTVRLAKRFTFNFEARNVTDNQISDVGGFPLPGRSFFGTIEASL